MYVCSIEKNTSSKHVRGHYMQGTLKDVSRVFQALKPIVILPIHLQANVLVIKNVIVNEITLTAIKLETLQR